MKAIALRNKPSIGSVPEEIEMISMALPVLGKNEILVKIVASTMHVDDIALAQGTALGRFLGPKDVSADNPYVMGSSYSGIIADRGINVSEHEIGDEVIGIPRSTGEHGAWAEYRAVHKKYIRPKPKEMSHRRAVASIVAGCVAYGMIRKSRVKKNDKCLVLGASGGIGSMVVQMLKAKGAEVTAICSSRNIEKVISLGADKIINYKEEIFKETIKGDNCIMDLVFDSVGGIELERDSLTVLNRKGQYLTVCGPEKYIGSRLLSRCEVLRFIWHVLYKSVLSHFKGPKYKFSEIPPEKTIDDMLRMVIGNNITIPIDRVIPFEYSEVKEALHDLSNHKATGRIVIDVAGLEGK